MSVRAVSTKLELSNWFTPCSRIWVLGIDISRNGMSWEVIDGDLIANPESSINTTSDVVEALSVVTSNDAASSVGILAWSVDIAVV